ncbi:MAG TPA: CBS domain-containing protein [Chloroflexia bacterium]|nr:CBS domain-containing protein [Chloroflexia bacterium]
MTPYPQLATVQVTDTADTLLRLLQHRGVRQAPVLQGDRLVGMVSQADLALLLQ